MIWENKKAFILGACMVCAEAHYPGERIFVSRNGEKVCSIACMREASTRCESVN